MCLRCEKCSAQGRNVLKVSNKRDLRFEGEGWDTGAAVQSRVWAVPRGAGVPGRRKRK